jgi:uncharacterized protein
LPEAPLSHYEQIICDADLSYLVTVEFSITAQLLYNEWKAAGHDVQSEEEWRAKQIQFLKEHKYFTDTAKAK